jgi:hypothetical protein
LVIIKKHGWWRQKALDKEEINLIGLSVGVSPTEIIKKTWSVETPTIKEIKRKYSGEDD